MKFISLLTVLFFAGFAQAELQVSKLQTETGFQTESSHHFFNFGRIPLNSVSRITYTITNTGTAFLQYASADIWGPDFDAHHNCRLGLAPGQRCLVQLKFWPLSVGYHSGLFEINFNGPMPAPETVRIDLMGEAIYR